jgi:signal transduction histidine kinase
MKAWYRKKPPASGQREKERAELQRAGADARAAALGRLGFVLSAVQDPVDAAEHVTTAALEFFQWDASFLVLYDAEADRVNDLVNIDTVRGRRQRVPAVLQDKPPSALMRKVIQEGPQLVLRKEARDPSHSTVPFGDKARLSLSLMFVPLRLQNSCIGVLSVQSYQRDAFDADDLEALQGLADHAAGALARLQAESELRASQERLRLAVDSAGLGTWEYAQAAKRFLCSDTCRGIFGLKQGAPLSFYSFLKHLQTSAGERPARLVRRALEMGSSGRVQAECRLVRPDAGERWVILRAKRFFTVGDRQPATVVLIGTVLDITASKQAEQALRAAEQALRAHAEELEKTVAIRTARLQETAGELEHLSYALVHDMRGPLRAMEMYAHLVEQELRGGSPLPGVIDFLRRIRVASGRLDQLIQDSLSYIKAVRGELALKPVSLARLLHGLLQTYPQLQSNRADIRLAGSLPVVLGSEAALTQCFSNLLGNAVKFVKPGRKPRVRVRAEPKGNLVRIWVEDNGIGVPENSHERIFNMFERATNGYEGTGIGLAIVRKLVQRMGGSAGVESEEGRGSRFWVELKRVEEG